MCPRSSDQFYTVRILYKMGHYFLDIQYKVTFGLPTAASAIQKLPTRCPNGYSAMMLTRLVRWLRTVCPKVLFIFILRFNIYMNDEDFLDKPLKSKRHVNAENVVLYVQEGLPYSI